VARAEELDVDDDELEAEYAAVAERVGQKPAQVRKQLERNGQVAAVRSDLRTRKALEWLTEHVELVDEGGNTIDRASLTAQPEDSEDDGSEDEAPEATTEDE
jgi:FKBP-type peptidyl-prolyl cis-trans isomerase (trigger factor)